MTSLPAVVGSLLAVLLLAAPQAGERRRPLPAPLGGPGARAPWSPANGWDRAESRCLPLHEEEVEAIARETGLKLKSVESDNFVWAVACTRGQAAPVVRAAERGFAYWKRISGIESWKELWGPAPGGTRKCLMVILNTRLQYRKFARWYGKKYHPYSTFVENVTRVSYWPQPTPRVCGIMHRRPLTLKQLRNVAVHLVGHLCMLRYKFHNNFIPPWLEEGFGCHLESMILKRNNCYCFSGGYGDRAGQMEKLTDIEWQKWKQIISGMVRMKSDKAMRQILPLRMTQLSAPEMGKASSVIDFLVKKDPKAFTRFVRLLKRYWPPEIRYEYTKAKGRAQERALKEAYGFDLDGLDEEWRAFVRRGHR